MAPKSCRHRGVAKTIHSWQQVDFSPSIRQFSKVLDVLMWNSLISYYYPENFISTYLQKTQDYKDTLSHD